MTPIDNKLIRTVTATAILFIAGLALTGCSAFGPTLKRTKKEVLAELSTCVDNLAAAAARAINDTPRPVSCEDRSAEFEQSLRECESSLTDCHDGAGGPTK